MTDWPESRFFVFSDDPAWAEDNLPKPWPLVFVSGNSEKEAHEDLRLIAACKHHIIANSSFSWWGAWLGLFSGKRVLAPAAWWGLGPTPEGLVPKGWDVC